MPKVICHVPLKVRFVGEPTQETWAALEERLTVQFAQVLRRGLDQQGRRRFGMDTVRERYDPGRESPEGYWIPSYDGLTKTTVPTDAPAVSTPPQPAGSLTRDEILQMIRDLFPGSQGAPVGGAYCGVYLNGVGGGSPRLFYLVPGPGGDELHNSTFSNTENGKVSVLDFHKAPGRYQVIVRPGVMGSIYRGNELVKSVRNPQNLDLVINFIVPVGSPAGATSTGGTSTGGTGTGGAGQAQGKSATEPLYVHLLSLIRTTDDAQLTSGADTTYVAQVEIYRGSRLLTLPAWVYAALHFQWKVYSLSNVKGHEKDRVKLIQSEENKNGILHVTWPPYATDDVNYEITCDVTLNDPDVAPGAVSRSRRDTVHLLYSKMAADLAVLEGLANRPGQTPIWASTAGRFLVEYYRKLDETEHPPIDPAHPDKVVPIDHEKAAALRAAIARIETEFGAPPEKTLDESPEGKTLGQRLYDLDRQIRAEKNPTRVAELLMDFGRLERGLRLGSAGPFPIPSVFTERHTAQTVPLKMFLILEKPPAADGTQTWKLLDLTSPNSPLTREGTNRAAELAIRAAFDDLRNSFRGNYPPGRLLAHVTFAGTENFGLREFDLDTETESTKRTFYDVLSMVAEGATVTGVALSVAFPGGGFVVGAIVVVGAVASASLSAVNLYDRMMSDTFHWDRQAIADVVNIAASFAIVGGTAVKGLQAGFLGPRLATVGKMISRPLLITGIATNVANAVVMDAQVLSELHEIDAQMGDQTLVELQKQFGDKEGQERWKTQRQVRMFGILARAAVANAFALVAIRNDVRGLLEVPVTAEVTQPGAKVVEGTAGPAPGQEEAQTPKPDPHEQPGQAPKPAAGGDASQPAKPVAPASTEDYLQRLRAQAHEPGSAGGKWDHDRFPDLSDGESWKPGDPIDTPTTKGEYPDYSKNKVSERYWKNRAHFEKQGRAQKKAAQDASSSDPVRRLSDPELDDLIKSGRAPAAPGMPGKGMELEHVGVPQRVTKWLKALGLPESMARRLAGAADPNNLLELNPLEHAYFDGEAWRFGRQRADVSGARWAGSEESDIRLQRPLAPMSDNDIRQILQEAAARKLNFGGNADSVKLRDALRVEINVRNLNVTPP